MNASGTSPRQGLFFGAGAGRCGTMMLSNLLNAEDDVLCLHEGKVRDLEVAKTQWLPFLTLENFQCYANPESAKDVFANKRSDMSQIVVDQQLECFGDIAYNNAPFVHVIPEVFPTAKLLVIVRDGRDFVRSVYTSQRPDPLPVGWLDQELELSDLERYIAMGRLRPRKETEDSERWPQLTPVAQNAWLWAETYRVILDGLQSWPDSQYIIVRAENFFDNTVEEYDRIRKFLGFSWPLNDSVRTLLTKRINTRSSNNHYILPKYKDWEHQDRQDFWSEAGEVMERLGYFKDTLER
ncbi:MAG: sulfotransferase [Paracoccaceae bacterium]